MRYFYYFFLPSFTKIIKKFIFFALFRSFGAKTNYCTLNGILFSFSRQTANKFDFLQKILAYSKYFM